MKRFLAAFVMALTVHGLLFFLGDRWMNAFSPSPGPPQPITISLAVREYKQPDKIPVGKRTGTVKKVHTASVAAKPQKIPTLPPKSPPIAKTTKPVMPPELKKAHLPRKSIKPKKSLKRLTRINPMATAPVISQPEPNSRLTSTSAPVSPPGPRPATRDSSRGKAPKSNRRSVSRAVEPAGDTPIREGPRRPATRKAPPVSVAVKFARPLYIKNSAPRYPRQARRRGFEGTVVLEVLVDKTGQVHDLRLSKSSGHAILDKAAISSIKKWLFKPGTLNGKKVKMWVRVPIRFRLD